jgi:hypothetical protein
MPQSFNKDPDAVLDFAINWADWLSDDIITASTWTVPAGITKDRDSFHEFLTVVWLSGGTAGETYTLVNRIETDESRTEDRSVFITVKEL